MAQGKKKGGGEPGGGEPGSRRMGSPEPGSPPAARRGVAKRGRGRPLGRSYSPEERRRLLEAWAKSGMGLGAFSRTVDVAPQTLGGWKRRYEEDGPFGLEPRTLGRPKGSGAGSRLPEAVKAAVEETKRRFPIFGLKRIGQWLRRFRGIEGSPGSVKKVLAEAQPPIPEATPRRKPRRRKVVRRFERARPGALWQTDITSFVLARHHVRVYLVVFLDDHSRYVVSFALGTSAKKDWVAACLMDGIQKYGKPAEVLSDQGPQYYSWRGRSAFQKLLVKEGIRHVVARSHHPQTLGKVERLWKTVGEELWDRVHPQELEEARERLRNFFAFYNHFRPHQGIEGGIPAERFFGAAEAVKRAMEERIGKNALQMALGERPRKTAFLVGQVGDRAVSVHGESGRLVVQTDEGVYEALGMADLGCPKGKEAGDAGTDGAGERHGGEGGHGTRGGAGGDGGPGGGDEDDGEDPGPGGRGGDGGPSTAAGDERGDGTVGGGGSSGGSEPPDGGEPPHGSPPSPRGGGPRGGNRPVGAAADAAAVSAQAADKGPAAGGGGAGAVGPGDGGGAAEGARGGDGDPGVVAGGDAQGGGPRPAPGDAASALADEPDGALGDGGGALEAAEEEGEGAPGGSRGGEPGGAEAEGGAAGAGPALGTRAGDPAPDASLLEEGCASTESPSRTGSGSGPSSAREGTRDAGSGPCSPGRSA